eukprot:jgi/Pico_ML_1/52686/g3359.t1
MPPKSNVSDGGEKEEKVSWLRKLACCFPQKSKKKDQKDVPRASKAPAAAEETAKLTSTAAATTSRTKDAGVEAMRKEEEDVAKFSSVGVEVRKLEEQFKYANKASGADEPAISDDEAKSMPAVPTTNLFRISRSHKTTIQDMVDLNEQVIDPDLIYAGDTLKY